MALNRDAYRDPTEGLKREREALLAERRAELERLPAPAAAAYARRAARVAGGGVGVAAATLVTVLFIAGVDVPPALTLALMAGAAITAIVGRPVAARRLRERLATTFSPTANVARDVDRLQRERPIALVRRLADAHEPRSVVLPAMAVVLCLALSVQAAIAALLFHNRASLPASPGMAWGTSALAYQAVLPAGLPFALVIAAMALWYSRNLRLGTVAALRDVYNGSVGEAIFTAMVGAVGWGMFAAVMPFGFDSSETFASMATFSLVMGAIGDLLLLCVAVPPIFAVYYRRAEAERYALGLTVDDFAPGVP